LAETGLEI
jgi:hypothetical protein